jgi:excisionase family DNA binding protein
VSEVHVSTERRAFFTVRSLATYLAISERTVRDMLARGVVPSYRVEGSRRIDPVDVDAYLARCKDTDARRAA